jgi:hypothetical protein
VHTEKLRHAVGLPSIAGECELPARRHGNRSPWRREHALGQEEVTGLAEALLLRFEWCVGTGCVPAAAFSRLVLTARPAKRAGRGGTLTAHREQIGTMISGASDAGHCTSRH